MANLLFQLNVFLTYKWQQWKEREMGPWDLSWLCNMPCESGKVMAPLRFPFFICPVEPPGVQGVLCPSVAQNQELELAPAESSRVGHKQNFSDGQEVTLGMGGILGSVSYQCLISIRKGDHEAQN